MFFKRLPCTPGNPHSWEWKNHSSVDLDQYGSITWGHGWWGWWGHLAGRGRPEFCSLLSTPYILLLNRPQIQYENSLCPSFLSAILLSFLPAQSIPLPHYMPLHGGREQCAPGQWIWIPSWMKRAEDSFSYLWENALTAWLRYESWKLYLHSCSLIQEAMAAAVLCAHLNAITMC